MIYKRNNDGYHSKFDQLHRIAAVNRANSNYPCGVDYYPRDSNRSQATYRGNHSLASSSYKWQANRIYVVFDVSPAEEIFKYIVEANADKEYSTEEIICYDDTILEVPEFQ